MSHTETTDHTSEQRQPITTRELVIIALFSSLGGALSTFIGYLGNMVNMALGVPFGAGQFMAGLHVFWIVLIRAMVNRTGSGSMAGLLKGLVEMFTGSTHGIVIVLVSLVQGIIVDLFATLDRHPENRTVRTRLIWWCGAGVASASNVLVLQFFYFANTPWVFIAAIMTLAFCSGVIFAGYFAWESLEFLNDAGVEMSPQFTTIRPAATQLSRRRLLYRNIPALSLLFFLVAGSTYYFVAVARVSDDPNACTVTGLVESPYVFRLSDFKEQMITIEAELRGAYIYIPPANYTGVLVRVILDVARPRPEATSLKVTGRDGYSIVFDLASVMSDERMLLTADTYGLWLIAAEYDGAMWVRMVTSLEVF